MSFVFVTDEARGKSGETLSKIFCLRLVSWEQRFMVREFVRGDKNNLRKSANCKAQISTMCGVNDTDLCVEICRFSQVVFVTSNNFSHNLLFFFQ